MNKSLPLLSVPLAAVLALATPQDGEFDEYAIYERSAPRAAASAPVPTTLPLALEPGTRIALIGNTLFDRARHFGFFETLLHQQFPAAELVVRNLAWSGDTPALRPRPLNFADTAQHLTHERIDVIFAAYGFNESFAGNAGIASFHASLSQHVNDLRSHAFNGRTSARVVLLSPIANENLPGVAAADLNNVRLRAYTEVIREVAAAQGVAFVDVFGPTLAALDDPRTTLTINGSHLNATGYALFGAALFRGLFDAHAPAVREELRLAVVDKNRQYFRRFRPLNTYYYTGKRNGAYGYLDFLPAMRSFETMVANREERIAALAKGSDVPLQVDDSNVAAMPPAKASRGANRWMSARDEWKSFDIDPRFEVTLFAGEEQFPDIAAPVQIRWDARGRLWVACSKTYPHVYPGNEPADKLVILEDTDGDGKADTAEVFADDLHVPLSFEFGDGGVYVSEMPDLTFLKDTNGDGKADLRRRVLTGFGTEDSHHALHDFTWTPDGDLIFRESVFHHSQVETPYGPVRQQNSGWFRFQPRDQRLTSFGSYSSTNPWGVTFDNWGQHVASHPIFASAFHAQDPPYPQQHVNPRPFDLRAYSGTAGQEFVDFDTFPAELQGHMIKARYKPTNRIEILRWEESEFGYDERYISNLLFSKNLSFIPVDLRFGPRGALYVCDWYNPIKGHMQYSLRDERRDRHSGRIWRIQARGAELQEPARIHGATAAELISLLARKEYRIRYWAKRELRERDPAEARAALNAWVDALDPEDARYRHQQLEALWTYRWIGATNTALLRELLGCEEHHARAAATRQLRYWHALLEDAAELLRTSANDPEGLVRLEAATAATYVGTASAFHALLDTLAHPHDKHLSYAIVTSLGSASMRRHWESAPELGVKQSLALLANPKSSAFKEPKPTRKQRAFDRQENLKSVRIACLPDRMKYSVEQIVLKVGQPLKLILQNADSSDHNLLIVRPGAVEEVGMAANAMARDPRNAQSDFIPADKQHLILGALPLIGPSRAARVAVLRMHAPAEPGIYPYVCTFPGHWIMMKGELVVVRELGDVKALLATKPQRAFIKEWTLADLDVDAGLGAERSLMRGMQAFMTADCSKCHVVAGHGSPIGPELSRVAEKYKGAELLHHILEPSKEINAEYRMVNLLLKDGDIASGVIMHEDDDELHLAPNLLDPTKLIHVDKSEIARRQPARLSSMPTGLLNVLTAEQIFDLLAYLAAGGTGFEHDAPAKADK